MGAMSGQLHAELGSPAAVGPQSPLACRLSTIIYCAIVMVEHTARDISAARLAPRIRSIQVRTIYDQEAGRHSRRRLDSVRRGWKRRRVAAARPRRLPDRQRLAWPGPV